MDSVKIKNKDVSLLNRTKQEKLLLKQISEIGKSSIKALQAMCTFCNLNRSNLICDKCPVEVYKFNLKNNINTSKGDASND